MILVDVRCITCKDKTGAYMPMVCIANIKIVGDGSMAHSLILESLGGIYQCPKCMKTVDIIVRER